MSSGLIGVDLCAADLQGAVFKRVEFDAKVVLRDAIGSVYGPVEIGDGVVSHALSGGGLQQWLRERGSALQVIEASRVGQ